MTTRCDYLFALQVSKVAEANPERMMGNTVAWRVRQLPEEVFALQRPLYQLNTYTDKQVARAHNTKQYCRYHTHIHLPHTNTHEAFYQSTLRPTIQPAFLLNRNVCWFSELIIHLYHAHKICPETLDVE